MSMTSNGDVDFSEEDRRLADGILATVANDNLTSYRFRTIIKMNPYMASNPGAVAAMANSPIPTLELMGQAGALYGMQVSDSLAQRLPNYSASQQRSIFSTLTRAQQQSLRSMGYEPPKRDVHEDGFWESALNFALKPVSAVTGGIGRAVSPVLSPFLDTLVDVGDMPFKVYRTVRQLDGASQFLAGLTAAATTAAGLALLVPSGGASSALVAAGLTAGRIGLIGLGGVAAGGATSFVSSAIQNGNTSTWTNAWSAAWNGERLFNQSGLKRASELLGDPELLNIAQELAVESEKPGDLLGIAKQVAGVRGAGDPNVQIQQLEKVASNYAKPGTPAYTQAYQTLAELLTMPAFQEAVDTLERSKISMGRDLARAFGLDPSTGPGRWLSGATDAASLFLLDPLLIAGGLTRAAAQARRGLHIIDGATSMDRFRKVAALPEVQRKLGVVARAVEARDVSLLNRGAREYRPIFDQLVFNRMHLKAEGLDRAYNADDVVEFLVGSDNLKSIIRGIGVVPGISLGQLRGLNRGQYLWAQATGGARDFFRGISDIGLEGNQLSRVTAQILKHPEFGPQFADMLANVSPGQVNELMGMGLSENAARIVARFMGNIPARAVLEAAPATLDEFGEVVAGSTPEVIDEARRFLTETLANTSNAYRAGRILGDIPIAGRILQPAASLIEGLTTRIPRGAMSFVGLEAADDVNDLVDLFRIAGVPSYVRTMWKNAILQSPTGGTRLEAYASLIDSVSTAAGFRLTKAGDDFIDTFLEHSRQIYSLGPTGRHTVDANGLLNLPYGVRPIADMATMIAVPDLHLMRRATQQGFIMRAALGIPESTPILAFQNKFWKPAVLLRVGFIVRNVSEEMLAMFVRYGTGRWAQELVGRQVGQREAFDDAFNKAMRKGQNQGLSKFDEHVLRKRYDVPVPLRPVARAIERMDNGRPWLRVLERYQGFLEDTLAYSSNRFYDWAINGYGGSVASAARRAALPVDREGATANLTNIAKRLAFGNPYSMRRMIIGGVSPDIIEFAKLFESTYLKSIMDQVGTTNLAPWDRSNLRNRAEEAYRTIVDENGNPSVQLVKVLSERDLATASNAVPGIQPHQEGVLSRRQELFDDEVVDAALGPFALVYNADLRPTIRPDGTMAPGLTPENLKTILSEYAQKAFGKQARWDDDLLHLWTIMHEGIFNRQRFDIKLRAMTFSDEAIEDMASPGLQDWARRRNEMVKLIRTAFPGQTQPTWAQLVDAVLGDTNLASHLDAEFVRARNNPLFDVDETVRAIEDPVLYPEPKIVGKPTGTMIDVTGIPLMDVLPGKVGFTRLRDQIEALSRMSDALTDAPAHARDWVRQLIHNWHRNPSLLDPSLIVNWNTAGTLQKRPSFVAYMGKQYGGYRVDDEGNLILDLTGRNFAPGQVQVSMSLDRSQAIKYSFSQVEGGTKPQAPLLFSFNGDALLASQGRTIEDVFGQSYGEIPLYQDGMGVATLNPPSEPFATWMRTGDDFGRRELAFARSTDMVLGLDDWLESAESIQSRMIAYYLPEGRELGIESIGYELEGIKSQVIQLVEAKSSGNFPANELRDQMDEAIASQFGNFEDLPKLLFDKLANNQSIELDLVAITDAIVSTIRETYSVNLFDEQLLESINRFVSTGQGPTETMVIPKGAWKVELARNPDDWTWYPNSQLISASEVLNTPTAERLAQANPEALRALEASTDWSFSPFYESLDEALPAMRFAAGERMTDPRIAQDLKLSPRWHTMPDSTPVYVVDTRTITDETPLFPTTEMGGPAYDPQAQVFDKYGFVGDIMDWSYEDVVSGVRVEKTGKFYSVPQFLVSAIKQQQPIIVSSEEAANLIADAIGEYISARKSQRFTALSSRPAVGKAYFPTNPDEQLWGFTTTRVDHPKGNFRLYGWDGNEKSFDNYTSFPLVWNWIDSIQKEVGPTQIMDSMIEHIISNVRAGRRLVRTVRDTDNVPTLYRNVMGEPVELMPGEIIDGDDLIYLSPKLDEDSLVKFSDQRYFEDQPLSYEGSNELLWPVMGPIMADHAESALGWRLYDLKNPIELAPIGSRRKETIYTTRTHVRSASQKHVARTDAGDLPDWEIVQRYRPVTKNPFERVVEYGFNNVVSPTIDALTRKPMAFHAFVIAAQRNRALTQWAIRGSAQERALRDVMVAFNQRLPESKLNEAAAELWAEFGRIVGTVHGDKAAQNWDNLSAIGYLRGFDGDEFEELFPQVAYWYAEQPGNPRIPGLLEFASSNKDQLQFLNIADDTDGFLKHIDRIFGENSAFEGRPMLVDAPEAEKTLAALTNEDWKAIKASARQRREHDTQLMDFAAEHAIRDVMPFVDSHEIRSQFAEYGRGLLPFWYAEENFLKRWAKMFAQGGPAVTLERIRKLQLTYMGLKSAGIVRTDAQGRDYFVYPGSELLATAVEKALPGQLVPITALIQTPTERIIPGFTRDFGRPSLGPFVAVSMDAITALFPETKPIEEAFVGREYAYNSIVESIVPRHVANVWNALGTYFDSDLDPSNQRVASAMNAAIAHLDATDQGLPVDATPGQRDDYLRKVRDHARIIVFSQALAGWFTPGPSQLLQIPEGGSLDWITNGQVTNPAELLSSSYYELISELGIEAGTQRYLELYPNSRLKSILNPLAYTVSQTTSPSGAPLPTTDGSIAFYLDNKGFFNQYPNAGAWLLPQREDSDDTRSQYAFDTEMVENLRERRAPTEFLTMVKYKEGANVYFNSQAVYEKSYQLLRNAGRTDEARTLNRQWLQWADAFRATHPLFNEMLTSDDARQRRRRVIDEMRVVLKDPLAPKAAHFDALRILQDSFDVYTILRGELGLDRTTEGELKLSGLKVQFRSWVDQFLINNPMVQPYWITVLQPEAGLE